MPEQETLICLLDKGNHEKLQSLHYWFGDTVYDTTSTIKPRYQIKNLCMYVLGRIFLCSFLHASCFAWSRRIRSIDPRDRPR